MRLAPKPYNHSVTTAESIARLDCISDGRVEWGTGRSATRVPPEDLTPGVAAHRKEQASGCDIFFCLANPYDIAHEQTMKSPELLGRHVIPELDKD